MYCIALIFTLQLSFFCALLVQFFFLDSHFWVVTKLFRGLFYHWNLSHFYFYTCVWQGNYRQLSEAYFFQNTQTHTFVFLVFSSQCSSLWNKLCSLCHSLALKVSFHHNYCCYLDTGGCLEDRSAGCQSIFPPCLFSYIVLSFSF